MNFYPHRPETTAVTDSRHSNWLQGYYLAAFYTAQRRLLQH
jgi:hypothetical protein